MDGGGKSRRQCVLDVPNQQPSCVCVCIYHHPIFWFLCVCGFSPDHCAPPHFLISVTYFFQEGSYKEPSPISSDCFKQGNNTSAERRFLLCWSVLSFSEPMLIADWEEFFSSPEKRRWTLLLLLPYSVKRGQKSRAAVYHFSTLRERREPPIPSRPIDIFFFLPFGKC